MMAPLVLVSPPAGTPDVVVAHRASWRDRVIARLRSTRLDAQLAQGVAPTASAPLALRAEALGHSRFRTMLGERIRHVLHEAREPQRTLWARVPLHRKAVLAAAHELDDLAARLHSPGPLAARGVAQVRLLLVDGASPLYFSRAEVDLRAAVARALADLNPSFGW
jgi:hypothetical protein